MKGKKINLLERWKYKYSWILGVIGLVLIYRFVDRDIMIDSVRRSLPPNEAMILNGMLWGDKGGISRSLKEMLTKSGLIHLTVVSGSNIILISETVIGLTVKWWGRKKTILMTLALVWAYAWTVGMEAPILRAGILLSIKYGAVLAGKKFNLIRAIILSIILMALVEPKMFESISFWLSWSAFMGVVTVPKKGVGWLSVWVALWTTPILALVFGKISLISPLTNMAVVGMTEIISLWGLAGSFLGLVSQEIAKIWLWGLIPWLMAFRAVAEAGSRVPAWSISFNYWLVAGWYLLMASMTWKIKKEWISKQQY